MTKRTLVGMQMIMIFEILIICCLGAIKQHNNIIPKLHLEESMEDIKLPNRTLDIPKEKKEEDKKIRRRSKFYVPQKLICAIIQAESAGNDSALGDKIDGEYQAYGSMQIWIGTVGDVNNWYGTDYTHQDMFDRNKAIQVCSLWLDFHTKEMNSISMETFARIWNAGKQNYRSRTAAEYWQRVQRFM